jgi:hypothetical protein
VGLRAGLDTEVRGKILSPLPGIEPRSPGRPVRFGRTSAPGKGPPVLIVEDDGWTPESVWTKRLEKKLFRLYWGTNLDLPVVQSARAAF